MKRLRSRKIIAAVVILATFVVMGSIFVPERLQADNDGPDAGDAAPGAAYSAAARENISDMGQLESGDYTVKVYATPEGPLFSVYDRGGTMLAELIGAREVKRRFPELPIPDARADVPMRIMGTDVGGGR